MASLCFFVQLPDRTPILAKGVFLCTSFGRSLFWNHSPSEWFSKYNQADPHPAAGPVTLCLGGSHIFKVEGQQPAGEELLVGDSPPLLLDKLLDLFMVDSCHAATPYAVFLRLGAKTGSKIEVMSVARSTSSVVALLMMVSIAEV